MRAGASHSLLVAIVVAALALVPGRSSGDTVAFTNTTPIVVVTGDPPPGCPFTCPPDRANPYPSEITVSGLSDVVADVNVTLMGVVYPDAPADIDLLLVAPDGTNLLFMSDACGDNDDNLAPINSPINMTFDDSAAAPVPADSQCVTGTFRPRDDDDDPNEFDPPGSPFPPDYMPPPAPSPSSNTTLSVFNGVDPNGTWQLYVVDDFFASPGHENGRFGGGWILTLSTAGAPTTTTTTSGSSTTTSSSTTTTTTIPPTSTTSSTTSTTSSTTSTTSTSTTTTPSTTTTTGPLPADVVLTMAGPPATTVGTAVIYTDKAKNNATANATHVKVQHTLPANFAVTNITGPGCRQVGQVVTCSKATVKGKTSYTVRITGSYTTGGPSTHTATVTSDNDPNPANNSASLTTAVS